MSAYHQFNSIILHRVLEILAKDLRMLFSLFYLLQESDDISFACVFAVSHAVVNEVSP